MSQIDLFRDIVQEMLDDIERGQTRAFVVDIDGPSTGNVPFQAVATLFTDYLRDKTMYEVRDKQYHMLGKVVRKIDRDSDEHVNLLRGAVLNVFPDSALTPMFETFSTTTDFNMPDITRRIEGPAIEILPIAIYV